MAGAVGGEGEPTGWGGLGAREEEREGADRLVPSKHGAGRLTD